LLGVLCRVSYTSYQIYTVNIQSRRVYTASS